MRIKICGIRNEADIKVVVESGADAAGFLIGQLHASHDFILPSTAARLAGHLPPYITPVIVTHLVQAATIIEIVKKTGIITVQLHGGTSLDEVKKLSGLMPLNGKLIFASHIIRGKLEPALDDFYPLIDAVLLDSYNKTTGQVGGTGRVHDWNKSSEIVKNCPLPVILAGGLNPVNVAKAVQIVKPYGVDANSGLKNKGGGRSPELCRAFVKNARIAFLNLTKEEDKLNIS